MEDSTKPAAPPATRWWSMVFFLGGDVAFCVGVGVAVGVSGVMAVLVEGAMVAGGGAWREGLASWKRGSSIKCPHAARRGRTPVLFVRGSESRE